MHCLLFNIIDPERGSHGRTSGAYRIAHVLREQGWDVEVIDFMLGWTLDELKQLSLSRISDKTKFIGFSNTFSIWHPLVDDYITWTKQKWSHLKFIVGSSVNPLYRTNNVDYFIQGWGENAIQVLLKYLFSNGERPRFWVNTGQKIINAVSDYPAYPMEDPRIIYEARDFIQPHEWLGMEFSRGCMFACDYCNFPLLGVKEDYSRSAESFRNELIYNQAEYGVTGYICSDETFNDRPAKIKKFADVVQELDFKPYFTGFIRPDLIVTRPNDRVDLDRMNFIGHYYGVETFNRASGKSIGKGIDPERLKQGLLDVKNYFKTHNGLYRGTIGLIVGLPHETEQTLEDTRNWLYEHWRGESFLAWPLVIPADDKQMKSKMFDYKKYGYEDMQKEKHFNNHEMKQSAFVIDSLVWKNDHMDFFRAHEICSDVFYAKESFEKADYKLGSFEIGAYCHGTTSIEDRLEKKSMAAISIIMDKHGKKYPEYVEAQFKDDFRRTMFLNDYKRKKLSL